MEFRKAEYNDISKIMDIIKKAQDYLKNEGIDQWQNGYPNENTVKEDIDKGDFYVLSENKEVLAVTALSFSEEETYKKIYEGSWLTDGTYAVIHRMATNLDKKRKGLASEMIKNIEKTCIEREVNSIKVDTHRKNVGMQNLLKKNGFKYCGIIYLKDGNERLAFEKIL